MRIGIQIDEQVYEFYKDLKKIKIKHPFEVVEGSILCFNTETNQWTWIKQSDPLADTIDLKYMSPSTLWPPKP